jgi:hypothetical protein
MKRAKSSLLDAVTMHEMAWSLDTKGNAALL